MEKMILTVLTIFAFILGFSSASAAPDAQTEHTTVTLQSEMKRIAPGQPFWMALRFELEDGWHIYWENPGDSGLAVQLDWSLPEGLTTQPVQWPAPERIEVGGLMNYGYEEAATLLIPMMPLEEMKTGQDITIPLKANWLICKEICIPESAELSIRLSVGKESQESEVAAVIQRELAALPSIIESPAYYEVRGDEVQVILPGLRPDNLQAAYFYSRTGGVIKHMDPQEWELEEAGLQGELERDHLAVPDFWSGVLEVLTAQGTQFYDIKLSADPKVLEHNGQEIGRQGGEGNPLASATDEPAMPVTYTDGFHLEMALWEALFLAFLGGLLLNAMPCVFPVLALKALSLSQKAASLDASVRLQGVAYLVGVVFSFVILAAMLIAFKQTGQTLGWGFQLQSPGFVAVLIYLFIMLGLALAGMFELPILFGGLASHREEKDSVKGSFLTGILAVIVATPCTVPFMAPAVGYAFIQPPLTTILIMIVLGAGLAFPYLALSFYPRLQAVFPRPGLWMELFKQFMAFPMFATAAWLLWVLVQQSGADGLVQVLATALFFVFLLWLGQITQNRYLRGIYWLIALSTLIYSQVLLTATPRPVLAESEVMETEMQPIPFSAEKLEKLRDEGKPVFVNATAAWCITCKVNERLALRSEKLAAYFREHNITYMVADWTNYDDAITAFLQRYERQGVPLYVYFPANEEPVILPQLLTESLVLEELRESTEGES